MTGETSVVCTKCGFLNAPGDQFCGSCGAFLEWEGSVVAPGGAGAPRTPGAAATAPGSGAPAMPPAAARAASAPAGVASASAAAPPATAPASPAAGGANAGPLLRCPACGVANAPTRTFCQSCGARLASADRVTARSREEIAAAVAAVPQHAPARPAPPTTPAPASRTDSGRSNPLGWILLVVIAGVLVGVGVIVVPGLLRGSGPAPLASSAPAAATPSASASASASAVVSARPASPKPSAATSKALRLTSASASSVAQGNTARYGPQNAIDGDATTSWQEGSPTEKGQWLEVAFGASTVTAVQIRNGFDASTALYKGNLRLKDVQISIDGGTPVSIRLKDTSSWQRVDLPATAGATRLRITIVSTYPAVKTSVAGTPFDDAAVSEVGVLGIPGS